MLVISPYLCPCAAVIDAVSALLKRVYPKASVSLAALGHTGAERDGEVGALFECSML